MLPNELKNKEMILNGQGIATYYQKTFIGHSWKEA